LGFATASYCFYYACRWRILAQPNTKETRGKNTEERARIEREAAEKRAQTKREIASDNQREAALQAYIDKISELLLHEHLGESPGNRQVETIARARTAIVLRTLDSVRRGSLIRFLSQAGILTKCTENELNGIDLHGANLSQVNLSKIKLYQTNLNLADLSGAILNYADLSKASLSGANLSGAYLILTELSDADLSGANLITADLSGAILRDAKVANEQLEAAKSLKGATMPDGKIHP
jgi:hypothetical protein